MCGFIIHDDHTIDHDYLDHGYITMIGYLDIDINGYVYSNSSATTPVNSVRVVTSVHATPAVTAGGKRGQTRKAPEGDAVTALGADTSAIRDAVDDGAAERAAEGRSARLQIQS